MNKRILIGILLFIVTIGVIIGVREFLSYKDVSVVFKQPGIAIDIYSADEKKLTSAATDIKLRLKEGSYYYIPTTEQYDSKKVSFNITSDETVEINPSYSGGYLSTLLIQEQGAAQAAITAAYPALIANYIIGDEHLAHQGEWYSAKLIQRVSGGNEPDIYRVVLKKENSTWKLVIAPRLIISISEFPAVPDYVIRQVNEPLSNEAYDLLYPM